MKLRFETRAHISSSCSVTYLSPPPHVHKDLELVYVITGKAIAFADHHQYMLNPGDLFISFPNQIHYYDNLEIGEYVVAIFSADIIAGQTELLQNSVPDYNVIHPENGDIILTAIHTLKYPPKDKSIMLQAGWLNLLMDSLLPKLTLKPNTSANTTSLRKVMNYCSSHYKEPISLDTISAAVNIDKYHISHLLNQRLGVSLNTYVNALRINKACRLLEKSGAKLSEISAEVGFGSTRSFNRAFENIMHMTPSEYKATFKPGS